MFLPRSVKIFLSAAPTDMRKSHNGLSSLVRQQFNESLLSGHLFVFYNKKRDRLKILFYDHGGLAIYYKRLAKSRFKLPELLRDQELVTLTAAELSIILAGLDPAQLKKNRLWLPVAG